MDDVLLNKAAAIERCVRRVKEEYFADTASFATNYTRQDAAILNIQRVDCGRFIQLFALCVERGRGYIRFEGMRWQRL